MLACVEIYAETTFRFCGCARTSLLKILARRARSLGVEIKYETEVPPLHPALRDADLVVIADGATAQFPVGVRAPALLTPTTSHGTKGGE